MVNNKKDSSTDLNNELDDISETDELAYEKELDKIDAETNDSPNSDSDNDSIDENKPKTDKHTDQQPKPGLKQKIKTAIKKWWRNKKLRYWTFAGIGIALLLVILIPPSRYFLLNTFGVRSKMSIVIYDQSSKLPLKNVQVNLSGQSTITDIGGRAELSHIKLGRQNLNINKRAFAEINQPVTIGWGSNPLGDIEVKPVGAQYTFYLTDWLTGKQIPEAEAVSGEFSALADSEGKIILTIDPSDEQDLEVEVSSKGYRTEEISLEIANKAKRDVEMVSSRKHPFFSRRSGSYDLYKIDVDGKNEELVLKATGTETDNFSLLSHPTEEIVAMVNTREDVRNQDGYLFHTLNIVDLDSNEAVKIAQSEVIKLIGWSDNKLVYLRRAAGASAANPDRNRIFVYDSATTETTQIASANSFNDIKLIGSDLYYAPGNTYLAGVSSKYIRKSLDNDKETVIVEKEVWNAFRKNYDQLDLSVSGQLWYEYQLGDNKATKSSVVPSSFDSREYLDSPDNKHSLWSEDRDGKGTLLLYNLEDKKDKVLVEESGLRSAIRWLDHGTLIYRVSSSEETADYVLSINGGKAHKIADITVTEQLNQ